MQKAVSMMEQEISAEGRNAKHLNCGVDQTCPGSTEESWHHSIDQQVSSILVPDPDMARAVSKSVQNIRS